LYLQFYDPKVGELQGILQEEAKAHRLNLFTQFEEHWPENFVRSLGAGLFD
jgi:hypothetical protein